MDPLSIATGAASLAASASTISLWLYSLVKEIRHAGAKLSALSKEVTLLTGLLTSIESTVRKCHSQALTLAHVDDEIWQHIENIMVDCKITLEGLDCLVTKIRNQSGSKSFTKLLKKPSMHFKLTTQLDEVTEFMKKTYNLNCALQTALAVFNISLSFRANASQDLLFSELQSLKLLVENALQASHNDKDNEDPFDNRLTRNLHNFAKVAQQFHSAASSTASTRYEGKVPVHNPSIWGGSDTGYLTDPQRERIEMWNKNLWADTGDPGSQRDDTTITSDETNLSLRSTVNTVITTPDLEESPVKFGRLVQEEEEENDDDSDLELDFLKNFDELAYTNFARKDYAKSEQFLRKAMERSAGDFSGATDFRLLRIRLAICCCLQDRWEFAATALAPISKSKAASNLNVFHLLQAISIGYLENDRFEDAHNICKIALQGKKKILGKTSDDFQECLFTLALIYEKKGDLLEAEAVRLSISANWKPRITKGTVSGKQYVLNQHALIDLALGKKSTELATFSAVSVQAGGNNGLTPGHWTTLVPNGLRDGLQQAQRDEQAGVPIGETDTGKEFLIQTNEELILRRGTGMGVIRAIEDEYSGKQVGEFDTGKEVTIEIPSYRTSDEEQLAYLANSEPRIPRTIHPGPELEPWWPMADDCKWESVRVPNHSNKKITRQDLDPEWYSTLEVVSPIVESPKRAYNPNTSWEPAGEQQSPLTSIPRHSLGFQSAFPLTRGLVIDLERPHIDMLSTISLHGCLGINLGIGNASFGMSQDDESVACTNKSYPQGPGFLLPGPSESNNFWKDYPWSVPRMLQMYDDERVLIDRKSLYSGRLPLANAPLWMENFDAAATTSSRLKDLEQAILAWTEKVRKDTPTRSHLGAVAFSVPDMMIRQAKRVLSSKLEANSLFANAKLLPSSLAIAYYFITSDSSLPEDLKAQNRKPGFLVTLNCDEFLVESTSYSVKFLEDGRMKLSPTRPASTDLFGSLNVELDFAKIARGQLMDILARFQVQCPDSAIEAMIKSCRTYFREEILPAFVNDGQKWTIDIDMLQNTQIGERLQLEFSNEMILDCFKPCLERIRHMLITSILNLYDNGPMPTHVLLAGSFAESLFLFGELRTDVVELGLGTNFLGCVEGSLASTIGTIKYLKDRRFVQSLDRI